MGLGQGLTLDGANHVAVVVGELLVRVRVRVRVRVVVGGRVGIRLQWAPREA